MKKIVLGILAHVDSGKTTLSEALLYKSGNIKAMGRVDNKNATLDTYDIEKERGITIFSKQAMIKLDNMQISLLDTPGHTDFSSEMERTLSVLDYAILVINCADGVQSHTETLWNLLKKHNTPTFIFVNKVDLITSDKEKVKLQLKNQLSNLICDVNTDDFLEKVVESDDNLLENYLNGECVPDISISHAIKNCEVYPCFYGSALKAVGIDNLLDFIKKYSVMHQQSCDFSAKVFKINRDLQNTRLTYMKIISGNLKVKDVLENDDKVQQIRIYTGEKYDIVQNVSQGDICAIVGADNSYIGQGFGQCDEEKPDLKPILSYKVLILDKTDPIIAYSKLKILGDEDPLLEVSWNDLNKTITMGIMGEIQIEILKTIVFQRFSLKIDFDSGNIVYKETISSFVEGVGHFEPLRHYAEVRLLLKPLRSGSGLIFKTKCGEDTLNRSFQSLILTHLTEKTHRGYLSGSALTDIEITLVDGKSHNKHTTGGDFRQATYRALQQGLRQTKLNLLEPYYEFTLIIPQNALGKAINDMEKMHCDIKPPEILEETAIIRGIAPVILIRDYAQNISSYTKGLGKISCKFHKYLKCHNEQEVISSLNFDSNSDPDMNPDSIFCSHGSGFNVKWSDVFDYAHTEKFLQVEKPISVAEIRKNAQKFLTSLDQDKELIKIFESTYGPIKIDKIRSINSTPTNRTSYKKSDFSKPEILIVDGYNIIFAWENLSKIAKNNICDAREELIHILCNYKAFKGCEVILVFDAYKVSGNKGDIEHRHNINIVYTKEAETADSYIEKTTFSIAHNFKVRVATSDALQQMIIWGHGAYRISAKTFYDEVMLIDKTIREFCI